MFLSGLAMGAVVHHHYLGIIPVVGWGLVTIADYWKKDKLKIVMFAIGSLIPLSAFVLFDLTHPPGLFLTRALYFNQTQGSVNFRAIEVFASYLFGGGFLIYAGGLLTIFLLFTDRFEWKKVKYLLPVLLQLVVNSFVGSLQTHYFIAGVIFYILWLLASREKYAKSLQIVLVVFLIVVNSRSTLGKILVIQKLDNAYMIDRVAAIIVDDIKSNKLINANVAVLQSDDINSVGLKYRDMLLLNDQKILSQDEYGISDNLYVITTGTEESLRNDPSTQMQIFKNGVLKNKWSVSDTGWFVYRFDKY